MLKTVTYEEARMEYLREQKRKAERSMNWWVNESARRDTVHGVYECHDRASEAADRVNFYDDCIKAFGGTEND